MRVLRSTWIVLAALASVEPVLAAGGVDSAFRRELQLRLIRAQPGDVIELPAGKWELARGLTLSESSVTLRGAGPNATVLSFKSQVRGAEGLSINAASNVTIENLAIEDTKGDAIKANSCKDLTIRNVRVEWTRGPSQKNGGYGLYPVQCERVLIEDSVVIGASDAGIYVGQSRDVVVRDNRVEYNVVGIEIENTTAADVYGNEVTNNTGGVLVINMPHLPVKFSRQTRVFQNRIHSNNTPNFTAPGNLIAKVPAGTGFMVLASDEVEFFDNTLDDNQSAHAVIASFAATSKPANDVGYDPYPSKVFVHDNRFRGGGGRPDVQNMPALQLDKAAASGRVPDIVWDGVLARELTAEAMEICIGENGEADFANLDLRGKGEKVSRDLSAHRCTLPSPPAVSWPGLAQRDSR